MRGVGSLLKLAALLALLTASLAGCGPSTAADELRCRSERTTTDSFDGLGVCYSANVHVVVKDSSGYALTPAYHEMDSTASGTHYWTDIYLDEQLTPGRYTLEVRRCLVNCLTTTYDIQLLPDESPLMTIVCL